MRGASAAGALFVVASMCACSLVESFDGYTSADDAANVDVAADGSIDETRNDTEIPGDSHIADGVVDAVDSSVDATTDVVPPVDTPPTDTFPGVGDYLCVFGGASGSTSSLVATGSVICAHLASDGTPETFLPQPDLPAVYDAAIAVQGRTVWIVGGRDGSALSAAIFSSTLGSDGKLSAWAHVGDLPEARAAHVASVVGSNLLVHGGVIDASGTIADSLHAPLSDLSSSSWQRESSTVAPAHAAAGYFKGSLYVVDGEVSGAKVADANRYVLSSSGAFGVPYHQDSGSLDAARAYFGLVVSPSSRMLFAFGGKSSTALDEIDGSAFDTTANILLPWAREGALLHARWAHATAVTAAEKVYVVGGVLADDTLTAGIERIDLPATARDSGALPAPRAFAVAAVLTL